MFIKDEITSRKEDFLSLCTLFGIKYIYAFGSSVSDRFILQGSDIDLIVELETVDPVERGEKLMELWDVFESFFNRKVDMLTEKSIRNPFLKKNIDATKVLIYDGSRKKILV